MKKHFLSLIAICVIALSFTGCELFALMGLANEIEKYNDEVTNYTVTVEYADGKDGSSYKGIYDYGKTVTLEVNASAKTGTPSYQWYSYNASENSLKAKAIPNATNKKYTVPNDAELDKYYYCRATNTSNPKYYTDTNSINVKFTMIQEITRGIENNTDFDPKYTYLIKGNIHVYATLKIPAGTVVKFEDGSWLGTENSGVINAVGTKATSSEEKDKLIYFTSYRDKSVGIVIPNTNGTPKPADWEGVRINGASGSKFENCVFRYAGEENNDETALKLEKKTTVKNCIFTDNNCINSNAEEKVGALNIRSGAAGSTVTGNVFYNNDVPLSCPVFFTVDESNIFHKEEDETIKNTYQVIALWNDETTTPVTFGITEVPYCIYATGANIEIRSAMTIKEGVIIKFAQDCSLDIHSAENGSLLGSGYILTSIRDDEHGDDSNGDGNISEADDGDWEGVYYAGDEVYNCFYNPINMNEAVVLYNDDSKIEEDKPND